MDAKELTFKVKYPQLEALPGELSVGRKRYFINKNTNSPDFVLGASKLPSVRKEYRSKSPIFDRGDFFSNPEGKSSQNSSFDNSLSQTPNLFELKMIARPAKIVSEKSIKEIPKSKFIPTDRNTNPFILKYLNHPLFQQPRYTRQSPKIEINDPITGYTGKALETRYYSPTPALKRGMAEYGNILLSSKKEPYSKF
ncbi:unnamed protein product [Blepharisma stoltei]|uniref:Uncharacterized protein n=1 Tax=Blepharisma stoltei TaxID=1481888 RepID=A0AAU9KFC7_9CILI|nr:unnamed protein product [Blepharisma stoltei]